MAEKWDQTAHILEENREFKEAMKGQVSTTSSSQITQRRLDPYINAYWDWYYHQVYNRKEEKTKILDYVCLQAALISIETH